MELPPAAGAAAVRTVIMTHLGHHLAMGASALGANKHPAAARGDGRLTRVLAALLVKVSFYLGCLQVD